MKEEDECIEMNKIGSNYQENGLPDEEIVKPPMDTDTDGGDHRSSNEEYQEKNSDPDQGAEEEGAEDWKDPIEIS